MGARTKIAWGLSRSAWEETMMPYLSVPRACDLSQDLALARSRVITIGYLSLS